jgi:uncharacterized membrane protein YbhN (UPF0104 family)
MKSVFEKLKVQKSLLWSVKFLVFVYVVYYLVIQLQKISVNDFSSLELARPSYLFIAVALVPVNWGFEFLKWKLTVYKIGYSISKGQLIQSLLAGISSGFITPNRIGNFIGRMLFFKPRQRVLLVLGTLYGNLSQFLATVFFGMIGLYFSMNHRLTFDYSDVLVILSIVLTALAILLYFMYPFVPLEKLTFLRKKSGVIGLFRSSAKKLVLPLLLLSGMRYLIFILQFSLLLIGFGADYSQEMIFSLYVLYLASTLTPNLILGKLVVRETLALIILGTFIPNPFIILVASFSLWIINLGFPALIGLFFFLKPKITE